MLTWTHLCRVYQEVRTKRHDLSSWKSTTDVYGEDQKCRLMPSEAEVFEFAAGGQLGQTLRPAEIWLPGDTDAGEGYVIEVKKARVINGAMEPVSATLKANAAEAAVTLVVDKTVGFSPSDKCTIDDGSNDQRVMVKSVSGAVITLHADSALDYAFAVDDTTIEVDNFYKVQSVVVPHGVGPIVKLVVMETAVVEYD